MFLSIDIGTSLTKCFLYTDKGQLLCHSSLENSLITNENGYQPLENHSVFYLCSHVEQDPEGLFANVIKCLEELETFTNVNALKVVACGITNQRESVMAFRKSSGEPLSNFISWMDVRTADLVEQFKSDFSTCQCFESCTGLKASTFFSAFKINWILGDKPEIALLDDLAFCTVDSWILWKLTKGTRFFTDPSNASRTFLYDIKTGNWSQEILKYFNFKGEWLPEIKSNNFGNISDGFPFGGTEISALIGDQQASLIGHWGKDLIGKSKCTFGTGAFLLRCLDGTETSGHCHQNALKTVIYGNHLAEEFPIISAGSAVKWLQNGLEMISDPGDLLDIDFTPSDPKQSVYFIPNLSGCLFPTWNSQSRASFHNISLQSGQRDFILAVLESLAFCIRRALHNSHISVLSIDGGMSTNGKFCQLLADICNCSISKTKTLY